MLFTHPLILLLIRPNTALRSCFVVINLLFCLFLSQTLSATEVELPLTPQDVQIKGLNAQASFAINIDAKKDRKTEPVLNLVWRKSRLIDSKRSTLSVAVNGSVRRTVWLSDLGNGEYRIPLTGLSGGTHTLTLRASLRIDDDPCLEQYREDAWFTIKSDTMLSWERRKHAIRDAPIIPINRYPDSWQRLADGWSGVHLDMQPPLDAAHAGAYLEANHLLRRWNYQVQHQTNQRTVGHLRLLTLAELEASSSTAQLFAHTPSIMYSIEASKQGSLRITGRNAEGLREAIALLADDTARSLCTDTICTGGATTTANTTESNSAIRLASNLANTSTVAIKSDPTQVWNMSQTDYAKGWLARGEGTHVLKFVWQRPATWKVIAWPMLQLHGQASTASTIDAINSVVTVRLNGRPLASYPLSQWKSHRSEVRIPTELWDAGQWAFEIAVTLKTIQTKNCAYFNEDGVWFTVGADTQLLIPRQEQSFDSVGRFFSDSSMLNDLPAIYATTFNLETLGTAAAVLYPFYQTKQRANKASPRWHWVSEKDCKTQRCVQIMAQPPNNALLRLEGDHWQATPNGLNLPHIKSSGTVGLFYQAAQNTQSAQLFVVSGPPAAIDDNTIALDPPDYLAFLGRIALFSQRWQSLDVQPITADGALIGKANLNKNPLDENTPSNEQIGLRWLNFLWAGLSVLVLAAVLFRLWRKPKNKAIDENWEMHD
jgi:hypothetical protein